MDQQLRDVDPVRLIGDRDRNDLHHAEDATRRMGRWLMVLDTVTGSPADVLYEKRGWSRAGVIPDYALYPDGALCDATFFYKALDR